MRVACEAGSAVADAPALTLENGLVLTYGEINGFAGDYFGFEEPISSESSVTERKARFQRWFDLLGVAPGGKLKAEALRSELKLVNDQADSVLRSPTGGTAHELAVVYEKTPLDIRHLDTISKDPRWGPNGAQFMRLLETNVDHFGAEARIAYNTGHTLALEWASKGQFQKALAINGFADHFLEDSFAAGHLRVPRALIMEVSKSAAAYVDKVVNAYANVGLS
ncbi:uncharacterized protein CTRU02_211474 [Colletotrichum truncatum]|uniref:Uncharacterized protein n=1 Tax=Colletotrichum truncatum TaxID=5467 RepID=A0ACC3YLB0_COLTU